jgi:hypothetical protein
MKHHSNKHRIEREFQIDDWVYRRLHRYRQKSIALHKNLKLSPHFFGPFQVVHLIGTVAYELTLPPEARIHPFFHVSCLKKKLGNQITHRSTLPLVDSSGELRLEPELIVNRWMMKRCGRAATEVLVRWAGTSADDDSWELLWTLQHQYPHLVGKVL